MTDGGREPGSPPIEVVVLKTPVFGPPASHPGALPYRADHLTRLGFALTWDDRRAALTGRKARLVGRLEAAVTPFVQTWNLRGALARAPVTLAFFESEGHALALARALGARRSTRFVIMSCWLGDIAPRLGSVRRRLYRRLYRHVDVVTVFSANQVPMVCEALRIPVERVRVIPFGIDTEELGLLEVTNGDYLLAIGRDGARDWATMFSGVAGTGRRVLVLARPSRLPPDGAPPEIEVLGYVERARYLELLAGCAGVLVVTNEVAYPSGQTVLLEALALGKRCIVSDTEAMRSFAADLPCDWVPVGDATALHQAVDDIDTRPPPQVPLERIDARVMWAGLAPLLRGRSADGD